MPTPAERARSAISEARSCFTSVPETYEGRSHLGGTIDRLAELVEQVVTLDRLRTERSSRFAASSV